MLISFTPKRWSGVILVPSVVGRPLMPSIVGMLGP
jgi:hypothetical protein